MPSSADKPARADGLAHRCVVALVEIGVRDGEIGDRTVEDVALAEVRRDRNPVAGASVGTRERPAAHSGEDLEAARENRVEVRRRLPVPQLADVEVALLAVEALRVANPAEEDVARRLHHPLALDHPLAVVVELALAEVRLEH